MKQGLVWNYVEPVAIESSGLANAHMRAAQQGLANSMNYFQQLSDNATDNATANRNQQSTERLNQLRGLVNQTGNIPMPATNPSIDTNSSIDTSSVNGLVKAPDGAKPYMDIVRNASKAYDVPEDVILAVMQTESGFKPDAQSPTGVKGLMQVTQNTYKGLGFSGDRSDPTNSINAGTKLLSQLYKQYGNWEDAFTAYNGGGHGVTGVRSGDWGTWSNNPSKQREISQYASRVNNYRTAWNKG